MTYKNNKKKKTVNYIDQKRPRKSTSHKTRKYHGLKLVHCEPGKEMSINNRLRNVNGGGILISTDYQNAIDKFWTNHIETQPPTVPPTVPKPEVRSIPAAPAVSATATSTPSTTTSAPVTSSTPAVTANEPPKYGLQDLPGLLLIYSTIMKKEYIKATTEITKDGEKVNVPNKQILKYVVFEIRRIEIDNAHPELLNTILYYFELFDFPDALKMISAYLSAIYEVLKFHRPKEEIITTFLDKSLVHHSNVDDFDSEQNDNLKLYNMYTHVPETQNNYQNAVDKLNILVAKPWSGANLNVGKYTTRLEMGKNVIANGSVIKPIISVPT